MRDSKIIGGIAVVATLGACASLWLTLGKGFGPPFNPGPHEASGAMVAEQTLALLKPGGQITIVARDTSTFKNPATDIQMASFRKVLRQRRAGVRSVLLLQVDPLRPVRVPEADALQVIRNTPAGSVVVSFMGPLLLTEAQRQKLGDIQPAIVAFCSGTPSGLMDLRPFFAQGLLQAAVVEKPDLSGSSAGRSDSSSESSRSFFTVTAANLEQLPRRSEL
jgi:hypothetical protein